MRISSACVVLALTALLSACTGQNTSAPSPTSTPNSSAPSPTASGAAADDVNCSTLGGKVGPSGGAQVDLIATSTPAGRVGCEEAFTVITEYYRDAPAKSEGTGHRLLVRGWECLADTGAQGSGIIGCQKDGLGFHTR